MSIYLACFQMKRRNKTKINEVNKQGPSDVYISSFIYCEMCLVFQAVAPTHCSDSAEGVVVKPSSILETHQLFASVKIKDYFRPYIAFCQVSE